MYDYLDILAESAQKTITEGYYRVSYKQPKLTISLKESILKCKETPIIAEIKFTSPSTGDLREKSHVTDIAEAMEKGGATGISVVTEPKHFKGNIKFVNEVRKVVNLPILMKDIMVSLTQIEAAFKTGADVVLLIQSLFDRGYCETDVEKMIEYAHAKELEVLLEVHTENELISALNTKADLVGINNRNLKTFEVDLETTKRVLINHRGKKKIVVSESGVNSIEDIRSLKEYGAMAFLIGTAIIKEKNIEEKLRELVYTL